MSGNYWSSVLSRRTSRRRALAGTVAAGGAAAFLAACGGGGGTSEETGPKDSSGLLSQPEDTTKKAVKGGIWQTSRTDDPVTLDVTLNNSSLSWLDMLQVYQHLTKAGIRSNQADAFEGDAAGSWEFSPDGLQATYKLRQGIKWDSRAPTNGRTLDSSDVKFSFDKFAGGSPYRAELFNKIEAAAPIESYSTPDNQTFVIKLAFPYGSLVEMTGYLNYLYIVPKEAETFDLRSDMRGSGPFRLSKFTPSVALEYERNPDYYLKDRPFLDGVRRSIVPEYATGLAQFKNQAIWNFTNLRQEDVLQTKREHPELVMRQIAEVGVSSLQSTAYIAFSQRPDSPLKDVRLRRAASMLIDRELFITTQNNTDMFTSVGLPAETWWNGHLPTKSPNWVDPRDKAFGENGKYFQHNPEEALKLIKAAGQSTVNLPYFYQIRSGVPSRDNEIFAAMLQEGNGFKLDAKTLEYTNEWREVCQRSAGEGYVGFCQNNAGAFNEDGWLVAKYTPQGKYSVSYVPIPGVTDEVLRIRKEIDPVKRSAMIKALAQGKLASEMYDLPIPGRAPTYSLSWPWFKNYGVFDTGGQSARVFTEYWYDASAKKT